MYMSLGKDTDLPVLDNDSNLICCLMLFKHIQSTLHD